VISGSEARLRRVLERARRVTTKTVRNMILDGRLPARTLGVRVVRIRLSDIDAALSPYGGAHVAAS